MDNSRVRPVEDRGEIGTLRNTIDSLRTALRSVIPPDGLRCKSFNDRRICEVGFSFFPGGHGVVDEALNRDKVSTIILGSDWGNEVSFRRVLARREYKDEKSFSRGRKLLTDAGFRLDECFFTNAWPVLRADDMDETSDHAMRDSFRFTEKCRDFFATTLRILKPTLVITLGKAPAWFVKRFVGSSWPASGFESASDFRLEDLGTTFISAPNGCIYFPGTHWANFDANTIRRFRPGEEGALYRRAREAAERTRI